MNSCKKCIHKPICNWVERNSTRFSFPREDDNECVMFQAKEEKVTSECRKAKNTTFDHTIEMMQSLDYKERFKAEYYQLKIRHEKLKKFNTKITAAHRMVCSHRPLEEPKHDCPSDILIEQQCAMEHYLNLLEIRAEIEGIDL